MHDKDAGRTFFIGVRHNETTIARDPFYASDKTPLSKGITTKSKSKQMGSCLGVKAEDNALNEGVECGREDKVQLFLCEVPV